MGIYMYSTRVDDTYLEYIMYTLEYLAAVMQIIN